MPAAISSDVEALGVPLGDIVLSGTAQEWEFICVNRVNAVVQVTAIDATGAAVDFIYRETASGDPIQVPAGAGVKLPVYKTQSWWFEENATAAPTLQASTVG